MRVAEGRHVDAEQLQLGGEVGAGERQLLGLLVRGDGGGGGLRLLVTGGDQAVHPAVGGERALADREDMRVVDRTALLVDRDAAALADRQARLAGQLVAGADTGAEHHQVGGEFGTVGQLHTGDRAVLVDDDLLGADARVDGQAHVLDGAQQCRAAAVVDLYRHQARRELDDVGGESEALQGAGRLKSEQTTADHGTRRTGARVLLDGEEVLDGAVDEAALGVLVGDRRYEGVGAGGEDEDVVVDDQARAGGHPLRLAVDGLRRVADVELDALLLDERHVGHREVLGRLAREVRGQSNSVVCRTRLLAQYDHAVRGGQAALGERFEEALADHAVADEDDRGGGPISGGH